MFFVEEKGSKFQVLESIKEKAKFGQLSNISKMLYFDKFDCFRWTRWSPLEQWWLNTLRLRESLTSSMSTGLTSSNVSHQDIHNPGNLFGRKNLKRRTFRSLTLVEVKSSDGSLRGPSSPEQVLFLIFFRSLSSFDKWVKWNLGVFVCCSSELQLQFWDQLVQI